MIMNLAEIASCITVLISGIALWKSSRDKRFDKIESRFDKIESRFDKIESRFDKIESRFDKVDQNFKEIGEDIHEVNVRLSVLEAETILYQAIPDPNNRSEPAKKMWSRRKMKALENHNK
jgi:DNA anti-recombination protein RmuC